MTTVQTINDSAKMDDKMPTLRKIKRAASRHTSQRFCSTFNFAQPHHATFTLTIKTLHLPLQRKF
jgi:hypothetical protein